MTYNITPYAFRQRIEDIKRHSKIKKRVSLRQFAKFCKRTPQSLNSSLRKDIVPDFYVNKLFDYTLYHMNSKIDLDELKLRIQKGETNIIIDLK